MKNTQRFVLVVVLTIAALLCTWGVFKIQRAAEKQVAERVANSRSERGMSWIP
jgi:hypothetical protein